MKYRPTILIVLVMSLLAVRAQAQSQADYDSIVRARAAISGELTSVAKGIENSLKKNDVQVAKQLYELEARTTSLLVASASAKYPSVSHKRNTVADIRGTVQQVLALQERVLSHTLDELDRALPGEPHRKLWAREGVDLYRPLFRQGTPQPGQSRPKKDAVLREMQRDFAESGGKRSQIRYLGPRTIETFRDNQLIEWVQIGNRIRVTDAGAKHPVIALEGNESRGKSVRGAGSMRLIRDARGQILMAIVSNSSGNYKPGIGSTMGLVSKLEELGVPARRIAVTSVLPGEPVLVKLLLKSKKKYSKQQIKEQVAKVRAHVDHKAARQLTFKGTLARRANSDVHRAARREARSQRAKHKHGYRKARARKVKAAARPRARTRR